MFQILVFKPNMLLLYYYYYYIIKQGGVISQIFLNLYIDPLLDRLRMSGFGCQLKGVYMGALSYADNITIMCPSIGGLNEMLKICHNFAQQ